MVLGTVLNPILNPLLGLGAFWTLFIVSVVVSLVTVVIYKFATDQARLKKLKADLKRYQKKAMAARSEPEKAMKIQKDIMKLNGEYMRSSFKSTIYTFLPIILFFGWLGANLAFMPLLPNENFVITTTFEEGVNGSVSISLPSELSINDSISKNISNSSVVWKNIQGPEGLYDVSIMHDDSGEEQFFTLLITADQAYENPINELDDSAIFDSIVVGNKKLLVFENVFFFKDIPWIKTFGWFGAYFLFSIVFSTALRKILKVA